MKMRPVACDWSHQGQHKTQAEVPMQRHKLAKNTLSMGLSPILGTPFEDHTNVGVGGVKAFDFCAGFHGSTDPRQRDGQRSTAHFRDDKLIRVGLMDLRGQSLQECLFGKEQ